MYIWSFLDEDRDWKIFGGDPSTYGREWISLKMALIGENSKNISMIMEQYLIFEGFSENSTNFLEKLNFLINLWGRVAIRDFHVF